MDQCPDLFVVFSEFSFLRFVHVLSLSVLMILSTSNFRKPAINCANNSQIFIFLRKEVNSGTYRNPHENNFQQRNFFYLVRFRQSNVSWFTDITKIFVPTRSSALYLRKEKFSLTKPAL